MHVREHGVMSREAFEEVIARVTERTPSSSEMDMLFRIFDVDHDGSLDIEELGRATRLGSHHQKGSDTLSA